MVVLKKKIGKLSCGPSIVGIFVLVKAKTKTKNS